MTDMRMVDHDPATTSARLESLLHELAACSDPRVPAHTRELVQLLAQLYGAGLARVLALVRAHSGGTDLLERLGSDPLVGPLLLLHDLHPLPVEARVVQSVDRIRALGAMRGVTVTLVAHDSRVVRIRVGAVSQACASAIVEITQALERAIDETAPEIAHVEIERLNAAPQPALIQITRAPAAHGAPAGER